MAHHLEEDELVDAFDDDWHEPSHDVLTASRVARLAFAFMNTSRPLPQSSIKELVYPDELPATFVKQFGRDRENLARCGVVIRRIDGGDETAWEADEKASFASKEELSSAEALALDVACQPLLSDPSMPFRDELRFALAKVDRTFDLSIPRATTPAPTGSDAHLATIERAIAALHEVRMTYHTARGDTVERTVRPYGLFGLRGALYLVAVHADEKDAWPSSNIRNYRLDRIDGVTETRASYAIPNDFAVADHIMLPFQLSDPLVPASFSVPEKIELEVRHDAMGHGTFSHEPVADGMALVWRVNVGSTHDAAAWAVAEGITPLEPAELVAAWRSCLEGAIAS